MRSRGKYKWDEASYLLRSVDGEDRVRAPRPSSAGSITMPSSVGVRRGVSERRVAENFRLGGQKRVDS